MVVSLTDQSSSQRWSNVQVYNNIQDVNGEINTNAIIAQSGHTLSAASIARAHNGGGFNDWYLPSRHELNLLWNNLFNVQTTLSQISGQHYLVISIIGLQQRKMALLQVYFTFIMAILLETTRLIHGGLGLFVIFRKIKNSFK